MCESLGSLLELLCNNEGTLHVDGANCTSQIGINGSSRTVTKTLASQCNGKIMLVVKV